MNSDAVAYLRIAGYYAHGQVDLMVSGYWGPLLSWLLAPLLAAGVAPLAAARIVMGFSTLLFFLSGVRVFQSLQLPAIGQVFGAWLLVLATPYWSVENISPDLLVSALVCMAISQMFSAGWFENKTTPVVAGLLWGLAYLAKAVALPLALVASLGVAVLWRISHAADPKRVWRSFGLTLLTFALVAGPWVVILSAKYHRLTFSTSAKIAHAIVGPADVERYHPYSRMFHQPAPGRVTSWEDPTNMPYKFWSPFASQANVAHQLKLISENLQTVFLLLANFDALHLGLLALVGCLVVLSPWRDRLARERWRWAVLPVVCLAGIYLPVYVQRVDQRYFYAAYPFLWAACVGVAVWLTPSMTARVMRLAAFGLVVISFAYPATSYLTIALEGVPNPAAVVAPILAQKLQAANVRGPVVGSGLIAGGRAGLYLAFLLNEPWHGDEAKPTAASFKSSKARLVVLPRRHPLAAELDRDGAFENLDGKLFATAEEAGEFPLKVYRLAAP